MALPKVRRTSKVLRAALSNPDYTPGGYLCHVLDSMFAEGKVSSVERENAKREITAGMIDYHEGKVGGQCAAISLSGLLARTDPEFKQMRAQGGHACQKCHAYKVQWFETLIRKLYNKGQ